MEGLVGVWCPTRASVEELVGVWRPTRASAGGGASHTHPGACLDLLGWFSGLGLDLVLTADGRHGRLAVRLERGDAALADEVEDGREEDDGRDDDWHEDDERGAVSLAVAAIALVGRVAAPPRQGHTRARGRPERAKNRQTPQDCHSGAAYQSVDMFLS